MRSESQPAFLHSQGHFRRLGDARYTSAVALTADLKAILRNRR
jgi:hypothetical protein